MGVVSPAFRKKRRVRVPFFFFLIFIYLFIYLFGCVGSSFLCEGFLQLQRVGATLHRGARASHCRGLSCCGAQAPDAQAQQLWLMGLVAPRHVGSSQTRARTRVPCIGRQIRNHCATREAPRVPFLTPIVSQVPLTQNNQYDNMAYLGVTCFELLHTICNSKCITNVNVSSKTIPL